MVPPVLIALTLVGPPKAPAPVCTLAGPPVQARWSGTIPPASTADAPLRLVADEPLPGNASRFDYQSLESASGRLFISHMGAGQLVVFDVRAGRVIGNLDGFPTVTGVLAVPAEHRAYASATGDHAVVVVDDSTLQIVARVPGPRFPDGIAYAPEERRGFVSDESGRRGGIGGRSNCVGCCKWGAILTSGRSTQRSAGCMGPPSRGSWRCSGSGTAPSCSSAGTGRRRRTRSRSIPPRPHCEAAGVDP